MVDDVYKTPNSELIQEPENKSSELASRWSRLGASIIDSLVISAFVFPLMFFTGGFRSVTTGVQPVWQYTLMIGLAGIGVFLVLNYKLLSSYGQTIGKRALGIKIVDLDNNLPSMKKHLLIRYAVYFLSGQVPLIGQLFSFVNVLFIFGKQKRCLHDYIAGTRVIVS